MSVIISCRINDEGLPFVVDCGGGVPSPDSNSTDMLSASPSSSYCVIAIASDAIELIAISLHRWQTFEIIPSSVLLVHAWLRNHVTTILCPSVSMIIWYLIMLNDAAPYEEDLASPCYTTDDRPLFVAIVLMIVLSGIGCVPPVQRLV